MLKLYKKKNISTYPTLQTMPFNTIYLYDTCFHICIDMDINYKMTIILIYSLKDYKTKKVFDS
jgi:hypothetical protein